MEKCNNEKKGGDIVNIVEYRNDINKMRIGHFTEVETDIFFSLLLKARDSKENIIILEFAELKGLIEVKNRSLERLTKNIIGLNEKLKSLSKTVEIEKGVFVTFGLFGDILTDTNKKIVEIPINPKFKYLIDDLARNFTRFDLKELVALKGKYSKILFRMLKQFEGSQEYIVKIEEFRELMGVPKSYRMVEVRRDVIERCIRELKIYFIGLEVKELKKGRNVETLTFTWKKQKKKKDNIIDIQPVKKKKAVLGEKELQEHEKEQLENTIQELEKDKKINNISSDPVIKLIKITKKDYENLYNEYLKQLGEEHNHFIRKTFDFINKAKYEIVEDMEREQPKEKTLFTEKDIDESLLVSKTGKKLVGMARQHKIKKLLELLNEERNK